MAGQGLSTKPWLGCCANLKMTPSAHFGQVFERLGYYRIYLAISRAIFTQIHANIW